jgi:hypothetical protein
MQQLILNTVPEADYKVAKKKLIALLLKKFPTAAALGANNAQKHCLGRSPLTYQRVLGVVVPYLCLPLHKF